MSPDVLGLASLRDDRTSQSCDLAGFSVADLCRRWKVGADKVHAFRRSGELIGLNVAANTSIRPLWRFTRQEVERFEQRRSSAPPPKPRRPRRRPEFVDFWPDA
jgi:hypothetical protein